MIRKQDILDRSVEWQLRPEAVEKDYVLGCCLPVWPRCLSKLFDRSAGEILTRGQHLTAHHTTSGQRCRGPLQVVVASPNRMLARLG